MLGVRALIAPPDLTPEQVLDIEYLSRVHGLSVREARKRARWEVSALLAYRDAAQQPSQQFTQPAIQDGGPDAEVPGWMADLPTE